MLASQSSQEKEQTSPKEQTSLQEQTSPKEQPSLQEQPSLKEQAPLSDRELQIVELVAAGLTNQEISAQLEISKRTVDNHISNVLNKTATGNRVALVRWALKWGKVCIDDVNCCALPAMGSQQELAS
ncbi:helix-turn-helix domain-containing protein [Leptothoe sp. PORK10 BA2]|uniref:photosynthetic electron transport-dependent transcriptional regulator PedR n=1 Tax=Leptothoe sp. PORK10 BA2 TaxID=3110254 RepID=UPI002B1FD34F|nr:helix-turn-helix transcriptional regulator [Leptothoe sp. PORK10 BA2]MEA5463246.1 helix-turn-helix transcriptional regulator [Leptothoe sp. PORK10 BA2]